MKYILTEQRFGHEAGSTVYKFKKYDYGLTREDTMCSGVEHTSVTLDPEGDYPFFTVPVTSLKEIK